ncbi:MAG: hypothetical protein AB7O97_24310 [Planctomycetota bacterium]
MRSHNRLALLVLGLAALSAAVVLALGSLGEAPPTPGAAPSGEAAAGAAAGDADTAAAPTSPAVPVDAADTAHERTEVAEPPRPDDERLPFAYAIDVVAVDGLGLPVDKQQVLIAPLGADLQRAEFRTDHNGTLRLEWGARRPAMELMVGLSGAMAFDVVTVTPATRRLTLCTGDLKRPSVGTGVRSTDAAASADALRRMLAAGGTPALRRPPSPSLNPFSTTFEPPSPKLRAPNPRQLVLAATSPLRGDALFAERAQLRQPVTGAPTEADQEIDRLTRLFTELQAQAHANQTASQQLQLQLLAAGQRANRNQTSAETTAMLMRAAMALPQRSMPAKGTITGLVRDETGQPAAGQVVAWRPDPTQPWSRSQTSADGAIEITTRSAGPFTVRVGGDLLGIGEVVGTLPEGGTAHVEVTLRRGAAVRGRAVDAEGKPLAGGLAVWHGFDGAEQDACPLDADGAFTMTGCSGSGRVWLYASRNLTEPPAAISPLLAAGGDVVTVQEQPTAGSLLLRPALPPGCEDFPAHLLVWDPATGVGRRGERNDDGVLAVERLPAGNYRVVVGADSLPAIDLGTRWIDGEGTTDLGTVALREPGDAEFPIGEGVRAALEELHRVDGDVDVRIDGFGPGTRQITLPPGRYLWSWRDADGTVGRREFAVGAGLRTAVAR